LRSDDDAVMQWESRVQVMRGSRVLCCGGAASNTWPAQGAACGSRAWQMLESVESLFLAGQ
jgi:hypothetical protein